MKLRNKLILSCAALAACATTMVSTTFAWYTSNTEVKVNGINGATSTSGSDLLLVANAIKENTAWNTQVDAALPEKVSMVPLQYSDGFLNTLESANIGQKDDSGYLYFDVFLKNISDADANVTMKITSLTNTTGHTGSSQTTVLPSKPIISAGASHLVLPAGATSYTTNVLRVLGMEIEEQQYFGATDVASTPQGTPQSKGYDLQKVIGTQDTEYGDSLDTATKADALGYYNAIMNKNVENSTGALNGNNGTAGSVALQLAVPGTGGESHGAGSYLKLTIKVFINGWDAHCFDACQGQTFTMGLSFSVPTGA